ncbi:hypothetical protein HNQ52_002696 [Chiayiivirga flava]|uniref:Uncharacterized protein n=1 Tax=Chiayiivirga flava TaxID=659595 RepID=A0A7W8DAH7_9GAMM|nr:hypothetical protein [Chiayiivirga flava]
MGAAVDLFFALAGFGASLRWGEIRLKSHPHPNPSPVKGEGLSGKVEVNGHPHPGPSRINGEGLKGWSLAGTACLAS